MNEDGETQDIPTAWARYWRAYGGWRQVLRSNYLKVALGLTLAMASIWIKEDWWDIPIAVLPSLLGFTLGGYALLLGFGDEQFKKLLVSATVRETTGFMDLSATFMHFILVQAVALLGAILAKALYEIPRKWSRWMLGSLLDDVPCWLQCSGEVVVGLCWFSGYLTFIYSITQVVALSMAIFRMSGWFNDSLASRRDDEE